MWGNININLNTKWKWHQAQEIQAENKYTRVTYICTSHQSAQCESVYWKLVSLWMIFINFIRIHYITLSAMRVFQQVSQIKTGVNKTESIVFSAFQSHQLTWPQFMIKSKILQPHKDKRGKYLHMTHPLLVASSMLETSALLLLK